MDATKINWQEIYDLIAKEPNQTNTLSDEQIEKLTRKARYAAMDKVRMQEPKIVYPDPLRWRIYYGGCFSENKNWIVPTIY